MIVVEDNSCFGYY